MYYKIINKESKVYKELYSLIVKEQVINAQNERKIRRKVGLEYNIFLGHLDQQNFYRVNRYDGFVFIDVDKVDFKIWKRDKEFPEVFVPNLRTKAGREMYDFLHSLEHSNFRIPFDILGLEIPRKFAFPYVQIVEEGCIIWLSDNMEPKDENVIEITKKEFDSILKSNGY